MSVEKEMMEKNDELENTAEADFFDDIEKSEEERKNNVNELLEKGKKGALSSSELNEALESFDYDAEKLYETLEENGVTLSEDIFVDNDDINEIENEVEQFGGGENMERILQSEGVTIDDPVRMYLKEIGKVPLLGPEREKELAGLMAEGNEEAKNELVESNLRLVVSIAKRYVGKGMFFLDLIQEGNLGLMKAVDKFDYTK